MGKVVIVPSIAGSMLPQHPPQHPIVLEIEPATPEQLSQEGSAVNYIRHPSTVSLLQQLLRLEQPATPEYKISPEDTIYIVSLAQRTEKSGQEVNVQSFDQLVIYRVRVRQ